MYICVIVGFVLLVSVGFKTSGRCFLKGGKYVTWYLGTSLGANLDLPNCRLRTGKYFTFYQIQWDFQLLAVR